MSLEVSPTQSRRINRWRLHGLPCNPDFKSAAQYAAEEKLVPCDCAKGCR